MSTSISKALKEKNRVVGEIVRLENKLRNSNSRIIGNRGALSDEDIVAIATELMATRTKLVILKSKISLATAPISQKLINLDQIKAEIKFWDGVPASESDS